MDTINSTSCFYSYTIQVNNRENLSKYLLKYGVETKVQHPILMCEQKPYLKYKSDKIINAKIIVDKILCLPANEKVTMSDVKYISNLIIKFQENELNECTVTRYDYLEVPFFLKFLQPVFDKLMKKWFIDVWEEDMPMRERRFRVWKLGFQDFKGIEYINNPDVKKKYDQNREYQLKLPIPKTTQTNENGSKKTFKRLFKRSKHIGYGLSDL